MHKYELAIQQKINSYKLIVISEINITIFIEKVNKKT